MNMASTAGVKYVSIFLHPPCFQGVFYIRIHRQILFSASSSKERHCRSGEKKNPTTIERLSKSSEIGAVSGRGIGQHDLSGALIRDMECEHRPSLRANKACTPPAAGI